ncbi:MAG: ATP-dependent helicase [Candidatus Heimdallarchaeum endolithica]|uniref:DNA 3'-5' helicase n=1 Tax=Candidatus Heimdallarchaeum endolithica TaxID=2876572 RepID=A0A9Y1BPZ0_9ARCH|nr:MAG: ATP-dependent helicase [Candidatus Heimdallarchaeum endolithica]
MFWTEDEFIKNMRNALGWVKYSRQLNQEQMSAVLHTNGPLWVLAGPGSGKTELLIWKLFKLIFVDGVDPQTIFLTTFTEKAAKNMFNRIITYYNNLLKHGFDCIKNVDISSLKIGTLHSLCNSILVEYRYDNYHTKRLMDENESSYFFYKYVTMTKSGSQGPSDYFWEYFFEKRPYSKWQRVNYSKILLSRITEDLIDVEKLQNSDDIFMQELAEYYIQYKQSLNHRDRCDFPTVQQLFLKFLNEEEGEKFIQGDMERDLPPIKYVLVDEYQDTNPIQEEIYFRMTELISPSDCNITVVGDDDQAMYRFRGATVDSLIFFGERVKERFGKIPTKIQLKRNYRSHPAIIDWFNSYIANMPEMQIKGARAPGKERMISAKHFQENWNPIAIIEGSSLTDTAEKVAEFIQSIINFRDEKNEKIIDDPSQIVILSQSTRETSRNVGSFVESLRRRGVPVYNPRNRKIHETTEVKQLLGAYIEIIDKNNSELSENDHVLRISTRVKDFIQSCRREYQNLITSQGGIDKLLNYVSQSQLKIESAPPNKKFDATFHRIFLRLLNCPPFSEYLSDPVISPRYGIISAQIEAFNTVYSNYLVKSSTINSLKRNLLRDFYTVFCGQILNSGLNDVEDIDYPILPGRVQIVTYHQSKGLEFPIVILLGLTKQYRVGISYKLERMLSEYRKNPLQLESDELRAAQDMIRLYYVGQTRAKYCLIFADKELNKWKYSLGFDEKGEKRFSLNWLENNNIPVYR